MIVHRAVVAGAVIWLALPLYVLIEIVVSTRVTVEYSFLTHTISDLAATTCSDIYYWYGPVPVCSPWHPLMNVGFALFGVTLAVGTWLVSTGLPGSVPRTGARVCVTLAASSAIATALNPIDVDIDRHSAAAVPFFFLGPVTVLLMGVAMGRAQRPVRLAGYLGVVTGIGCGIAAVWSLVHVVLAYNWAIAERLALWPIVAWTFIAGICLLVARTRMAPDLTSGVRAGAMAGTWGSVPPADAQSAESTGTEEASFRPDGNHDRAPG